MPPFPCRVGFSAGSSPWRASGSSPPGRRASRRSCPRRESPSFSSAWFSRGGRRSPGASAGRRRSSGRRPASQPWEKALPRPCVPGRGRPPVPRPRPLSPRRLLRRAAEHPRRAVDPEGTLAGLRGRREPDAGPLFLSRGGGRRRRSGRPSRASAASPRSAARRRSRCSTCSPDGSSAGSAAAAATIFFLGCRWHLNFSRIGFNGIVSPLMELLTLLAPREGSRNGTQAFTGSLFGAGVAVGLQTYYAFNLFPAVFAAAVVSFAFRLGRGAFRAEARKILPGLAPFGGDRRPFSPPARALRVSGTRRSSSTAPEPSRSGTPPMG